MSKMLTPYLGLIQCEMFYHLRNYNCYKSDPEAASWNASEYPDELTLFISVQDRRLDNNLFD